MVDKSREIADSAAMVLQVQKEPKIQANEVPNVSESPTRQLSILHFDGRIVPDRNQNFGCWAYR